MHDLYIYAGSLQVIYVATLCLGTGGPLNLCTMTALFVLTGSPKNSTWKKLCLSGPPLRAHTLVFAQIIRPNAELLKIEPSGSASGRMQTQLAEFATSLCIAIALKGSIAVGMHFCPPLPFEHEKDAPISVLVEWHVKHDSALVF